MIGFYLKLQKACYQVFLNTFKKNKNKQIIFAKLVWGNKLFLLNLVWSISPGFEPAPYTSRDVGEHQGEGGNHGQEVHQVSETHHPGLLGFSSSYYYYLMPKDHNNKENIRAKGARRYTKPSRFVAFCCLLLLIIYPAAVMTFPMLTSVI